jgi:hypothetical protein
LLVTSLMVPAYTTKLGVLAGEDTPIRTFIHAVVFVGGFFSFGFGGLVYLGFERDIRIAIDRARLTTLSTMQTRRLALASIQKPSSEEASELVRLESASGSLAGAGYSRTNLQTFTSSLLVILPPAVSVVVATIEYYAKHPN